MGDNQYMFGPNYPSVEEMQKFLEETDWTKEEEERIVGERSLGPIYHHPDNPNFGAGLHAAYIYAKNSMADKKRKNAIINKSANLKCNNCGTELAKYDYCKDETGMKIKGHVGYYGLVNAEVKTGYFSEDLPDGQRYIFSICEKCLKEMFDKFKIPPEMEYEL